MTDLALLKELLALLDASSATTIEIRRGFTTYRVSREGAHGAPVYYPAPNPGAAAALPAAAPASAAPGAPPTAGGTRLLEVKSPMVGTFYRAPEPGAEPYVKVGNRVTAGQTLCIIEAMKIMNELESEVTGAVREILVEDAQPVEFGQVLFRVEPSV
ncbi:MAG TPA: acetyl-CoA carboxylase biotin carboxyl carrier protein [Candidatus Methylomirabilis sp.]|nr:acetyl-CoA carboxylase biotin carboxyl carrier protein [Gemmatimonadales bacterium]HYB43064.1 acetyl-CoA carboxylase biotin carboxyl carrier protein [Candidatus Methylomirabilis sp.]